MALASISYPADGVNNIYSVPFGYTNRSDITVYLNGISVYFEWVTSSTIRVVPIPDVGLTVTISRSSDISNRAVNFSDGAVLTGLHLNKNSNQNYFLIQELRDSIENIEAGMLSQTTVDNITYNAAQSVFNDPAYLAITGDIDQHALSLSQHAQYIADNILAISNLSDVSDQHQIDINTLQTTVNDPITGVGASATAISALDTRVGTNEGTLSSHSTSIDSLSNAVNDPITGLNASATAISALDTRVDSAEGTLSSHSTSISSLNTTVGGHSTSISNLTSTTDGLSAQYTVKVDNNGWVSGFGLASTPVNGTPYSSFVVLADKFAVVTPSAPGTETPTVPFTVESGNVRINGNLIVTNSIVGSKIAAGQISASHISVTNLSSINASFGSITSGDVTLTSPSGRYLWLSGNHTYPLWYGIGARNDANGIFYVKDDGSAVFKGTLEAATGTFSGALNAATGTFAGSLNAATGTFSGTLTAGAVNAVDTINIAGNAVTIPLTSYSAAAQTVSYDTWTQIQSRSITSAGQPIIILAGCDIDVKCGNTGDVTDTGWAKLRLYRDSTLLMEVYANTGAKKVTAWYDQYNGYTALQIMDQPGVGSFTYRLEIYAHGDYGGVSGTSSVTYRGISLIEAKR